MSHTFPLPGYDMFCKQFWKFLLVVVITVWLDSAWGTMSNWRISREFHFWIWVLKSKAAQQWFTIISNIPTIATIDFQCIVRRGSAILTFPFLAAHNKNVFQIKKKFLYGATTFSFDDEIIQYLTYLYEISLFVKWIEKVVAPYGKLSGSINSILREFSMTLTLYFTSRFGKHKPQTN